MKSTESKTGPKFQTNSPNSTPLPNVPANNAEKDGTIISHPSFPKTRGHLRKKINFSDFIENKEINGKTFPKSSQAGNSNVYSELTMTLKITFIPHSGKASEDSTKVLAKRIAHHKWGRSSHQCFPKSWTTFMTEKAKLIFWIVSKVFFFFMKMSQP